MRLTPEQIHVIVHSARDVFGLNTEVVLFGSRVDDDKRGGDIDLLIRPGGVSGDALVRKVRFLSLLERRLGERKIDVVIEAVDDTRPIVQVARATGVRL